MFIRSYMGRLLAAIGGLLFTPHEAFALQYGRITFDPPLIGITATGPIVAGDFDRLDAFVKTLSQTDRILSFFVDSPGGDIFEVEKIAVFINKTSAGVTIPSGSQCSSACFLLFAAAAHRFMAPDALVGVHSVNENGQENLTSMGFTTALARDAAAYGVPPAIIGKMVQTEPGRIAWLTPTDLQPMGVVVLTPSSPQARPSTTAPPQTVTAAPPQTAPTAQPGEMLLFVMPVSGAPGDGQASLTIAMKNRLSARGLNLANAPGMNVYTVAGIVTLSKAESSWWRRQQSIRIDWQVLDPSGKRLGTISQQNTIPRGSLNGHWGAIATAAAGAASDGVIKLFTRYA
jgi:Clp protease